MNYMYSQTPIKTLPQFKHSSAERTCWIHLGRTWTPLSVKIKAFGPIQLKNLEVCGQFFVTW
jgi:hypothetical protein